MSYKLLKDGVVVDAVALPVFVRYNKRVGLFFTCEQKDAGGIAAHDGSTYWQLEGTAGFGIDGYQTVIAEPIAYEDAVAIIEALDAGKELPEEPEPEPPPVEPLPDGSLALVQKNIIANMSKACHDTICAGVDLEMDDGKIHHFSFRIEDQMNLMSLRMNLDLHEDGVLYHADGEPYRYFSKKEFMSIVGKLEDLRKTQVSYFSKLRDYIMTLTTISQLSSVTYGMELQEKGGAV